MAARDQKNTEELEGLRRELDRRLREIEDLRLISESRAARLAERERELSGLKLELARRNRASGQARPGGGSG